MNKFAIIGDSTCDLTGELRAKYNIEYARMSVTLGNDVDAKEIYADLDWPEISPKEYYDLMRNGKISCWQTIQTIESNCQVCICLYASVL